MANEINRPGAFFCTIDHTSSHKSQVPSLLRPPGDIRQMSRREFLISSTAGALPPRSRCAHAERREVGSLLGSSFLPGLRLRKEPPNPRQASALVAGCLDNQVPGAWTTPQRGSAAALGFRTSTLRGGALSFPPALLDSSRPPPVPPPSLSSCDHPTLQDPGRFSATPVGGAPSGTREEPHAPSTPLPLHCVSLTALVLFPAFQVAVLGLTASEQEAHLATWADPSFPAQPHCDLACGERRSNSGTWI